MKPKKSIRAFIGVTVFGAYVFLSTVQMLRWNYYYQGVRFVKEIADRTDLGKMNFVWHPGSMIGSILTNLMGDPGPFVGAILTFFAGATVILLLFGITLKDLADAFDEWVKRGPYDS